MRIVGGELRGRRLFAPRGMQTRPTADRTREAVFNILGGAVRGAVVVDLFAGTGALGLEALSRGAQWAAFVDRSPAALQVLRRNILACGLEPRAGVFRWDIRRSLNCLAALPRPAEVALLDPPYGSGLAGVALAHLDAGGHLAPGAVVVVEHGLNDIPPPAAGRYRAADRRRYGKTLVTFFEYVV